ncbi:peptide chain release factor N(5)-glutamine methyltransferase [Planktothrix mougeotii]|uniref:Release factor glutamine methyltransferase n=1 Tax=Planktothrix mougeotii LEGE 06226 TaxID=1828728 RepID=A0ABR9UFS3_9CYAN|nr:peptide chain release factor N(5)-glutamine methyltransferase [Planktothrix mougeotii]MBE9144661.1 peptide chain release factor N(5)-glutamine methyltransferase [Planktothrix mougeotii LEGE 06226]
MIQETISGWQLGQWLEDAKAECLVLGISAHEVHWFVQELTGLDRLTLRLQTFKQQPSVPLQVPWSELTQLWQRRLTERIPVQYLVGVTHWRQFTLKVSPAVLIPRPETELIIDLAQSAAENLDQDGIWADLGTGSGAIAIGLADIFPRAEIHGVDTSLEALAIAQYNAETTGFADRIQFHHGSWWQPLDFLQGKLTGMVSNPPYIPSNLIPTLQPEVAHHEPTLALDGGGDGLDCIRDLVETAPRYLRSGGLWIVEIMAGQGEAVAGLLQAQGSYSKIKIISDLAGFDRFVIAYLK